MQEVSHLFHPFVAELNLPFLLKKKIMLMSFLCITKVYTVVNWDEACFVEE